jgi:predicted RNase H-like HicB family nuclease
MSGKLRYTVVIESGSPGANYSAYVPDLPGCISTGDSLANVKENLVEAIQLHLHGILQDRDAIPNPETGLDYDPRLDSHYAGPGDEPSNFTVDYVDVPNNPDLWKQGVVEIRPRRTGLAKQA